MGDGADGSGVTIHKPGEGPQYERPVDRALRQRRERNARIAEHQARDRAFQAEQAGKALVGPPANKMLDGAPENKAAKKAGFARADLEAQTVGTLRALAEEAGVSVPRVGGRKPRKTDYIDALAS